MERRLLTDAFSVSPQIEAEDMVELATQGVVRVINNRPDGESADQPSGAELEAAARAAGLDYVAVPIVRLPPTPEQAEAVRRAVSDAHGPVHAFCKSGTRSAFAWAAGEALAGARSPEELIEAGARGGYDLSPLFR